MTFNLRHAKVIDETIFLRITEDNKATIQLDEIGPITIQLESNEEADKMFAEFIEESGDAMSAEDSVFSKYEQLRQFRP